MSPHGSFGPITILCIDDEPSILRLEQEAFQAVGHRVLTAQGGLRGLEILARTSVDAVVLDYRMPGMDGLAVALEIRRVAPEMPIIVYSGTPEQIPARLHELATKVVDKGDSLDRLKAALQAVPPPRAARHRVRTHPRHRVDIRVLLTAKQEVRSSPTWINVRSLGEGGIGAEVPMVLETGDAVLINLMLSDRMLVLPASVRYHSGAFHGFQFLDITNEQQKFIRQHCQAMP